MAVSVGLRGLDKVFPLIARGLLERYKADHDYPLDIIIAENLRNADILFHSELAKLLPKFYPIDKLVGLIETSIGKMVPIMTQKELEEDSLKVFAEPYNSLIVAKNGFRNPIPDLKYLEPKDNIKAWVDRKLFIHNLGHATVAYLGFQKNCKWVFIHDALSDHEIFMTTRCTMLQSADILMAIYPGEFTRSQLESHIDDLLDRFQNKALGDTIFRVGCDLYRKLSPSDRLVAPIHAAIILNKPYDLILKSLMAAISFCAVDDNGKYYPADEKFFSESEKGISYILEHICKLNTVSLNWE
jgi:mannitol-1-phosphate 5-dehydrogenase